MMASVTFIEDFDDNEDDSGNKLSKLANRIRPSNRVWLKAEEYLCPEDAEKAVSLQKVWKKASSKNTLDGVKVEYRCSEGQYRVNECPARLYLLYHNTSAKVSLFKTDSGHDNHTTEKKRGISDEMKTFIRQKFEEGIQKPNAILAVIRQKNMPEIEKSKLNTYLKQLRLEKYGVATISGTEITEWCKAREQIPDHQDEPFVLKYLISCETFDPEEQDIKIVISTLRLLGNLEKSLMVQIDATYKLIWQGYPVMVVGTSDKNHVFHPFAIAVCKGESGNDFTFIFDALHNFNLAWQPEVLLADASQSITQGFTNVFGVPKIRLMCFFHVLTNVEKYFKRLTKSNPNLKPDIHALQTCNDETTFLKASELFLKKWEMTDEDGIKDFIDYFRSQWLHKNFNWYEGISVGYPSTNNGIEATNAIIKKQHTLRERLPVGQFLNSVLSLLVTWSKERDPQSPNFKMFSDVPSISLQQWTLAYHWAVSNKKVLQENNGSDCITFYTCSKTNNQPLTIEQLATFKQKNGKWETFDDFKKWNYGIWTIIIDQKELNKSNCTCPYFLKQQNCKHVLGMKIRLKLVDVPTEAKLIPLGQKRKRGRPAKAKPALIIQ